VPRVCIHDGPLSAQMKEMSAELRSDDDDDDDDDDEGVCLLHDARAHAPWQKHRFSRKSQNHAIFPLSP
jgi:hypothetical protein